MKDQQCEKIRKLENFLNFYFILKGPTLGSDYLQVAFFVIRRYHNKYCIKRINQSQNITEEHGHQQYGLT